MLSVLVEAVLPLPAASRRHAGRDRRDHGAVVGHPADRHVVGRAAAGHGGRRRARRAAEGHVAGREAGDRLAEHDREVDRRRVRRIGLAGRLVDRHRRRGGVVGDRVVGAGRGGVAVAGGIGGAAGRRCVAITVPSVVMPLTATL